MFIQVTTEFYIPLESVRLEDVGGLVHLFVYGICLSAGVIEWQPYCFFILFHHTPPKVASVLVLFVIFGGQLVY